MAHPLDDVRKDTVEEFKSLRKSARRSKTTPLGKERVSKQQLRQRFEGLSPQGRETLANKLINEMGFDAFMEAVRGN